LDIYGLNFELCKLDGHPEIGRADISRVVPAATGLVDILPASEQEIWIGYVPYLEPAWRVIHMLGGMKDVRKFGVSIQLSSKTAGDLQANTKNISQA
jgi:hypothetical protein